MHRGRPPRHESRREIDEGAELRLRLALRRTVEEQARFRRQVRLEHGLQLARYQLAGGDEVGGVGEAAPVLASAIIVR